MINETKILNVILGEVNGLNNTFRFSGTRLNQRQSVTEHSYWVGILSIIIVEVENYYRSEMAKKKADQNLFDKIDENEVLKLALFHDVEEYFTGDINHEFKYYFVDDKNKNNLERHNSFKEQLSELTDIVLRNKLKKYPVVFEKYSNFKVLSPKDSEIKLIVKICDWFQLIQFLYSEVSLGNKNKKVVEIIDRLFFKLNKLLQDEKLESRNFLQKLSFKLEKEINSLLSE